jgi:farnesyl-diphosphate farnesyltransferase
MGLFLQKTNIIRDFHEDLLEGRLFWPKEIWSKYCNDPKEFCDEKNIDKALACLNHLCMDVLEHIPDAIDYMSKLRNQSVFNFCAIPQVMAISTIALVFNNPEVFKRNVKIRKGLACKVSKKLIIIIYTNHDISSFWKHKLLRMYVLSF